MSEPKIVVVVNQRVSQQNEGCFDGCVTFFMVCLIVFVGLPILFGCLGSLVGR